MSVFLQTSAANLSLDQGGGGVALGILTGVPLLAIAIAAGVFLLLHPRPRDAQQDHPNSNHRSATARAHRTRLTHLMLVGALIGVGSLVSAWVAVIAVGIGILIAVQWAAAMSHGIPSAVPPRTRRRRNGHPHPAEASEHQGRVARVSNTQLNETAAAPRPSARTATSCITTTAPARSPMPSIST